MPSRVMTLWSKASSKTTRNWNLPAAERAMLDYAVKLTVAPSSGERRGYSIHLRAHGFDDRDILDIVYVICLYNFNDRMADAMGISGHDFLNG